MAALPGGELFFDSKLPKLQLDTDGATGLAGDPTHQSDTSLHYHDGTPIDANRVPYFVLPLPTTWPRQFGIGLGDLAAVIFGGRIAFAVFADFGPKTLLGEGSLGSSDCWAKNACAPTERCGRSGWVPELSR